MDNKKGYAALERCGKALYDEHNWKKSIERQLGISRGAVDNWRKSCEKWPDFEIKPGIWVKIISMLKQKQAEPRSWQSCEGWKAVLGCKGKHCMATVGAHAS